MQFTIPIRCIYQGTVTVEAESADEAAESVNKGNWQSEELHSLIDWEATGRPRTS